MQRYENGRDMAYEFFDSVRRALYQAAGVNNTPTPMNPGGFNSSGSLDPLGMSSNSALQSALGSIRLQRGVTPSDTVVQQVIAQMGGNPYLPAGQSTGAGEPTGGGPPVTARRSDNGRGSVGGDNRNGGANPQAEDTYSMLQQLASQFASEQQAAKDANLARYDHGIGELDTLRDRNQGRVQNWGKAAEADLQEQMKEALGNISANLAARGLGNSNILGAFTERNARDTARERQRISEMRDSRASQYDTQDTNNLVGFIERRNDIAPSYDQLIGIANQIGQAKAMEQFRQDRLAQQGAMQNQAPAYLQPSYAGLAPPAGPHISGVGSVNLFEGAMNSLPQYAWGGPGIVSNRYPEVYPSADAPQDSPAPDKQGRWRRGSLESNVSPAHVSGPLGIGAGPAGLFASLLPYYGQ